MLKLAILVIALASLSGCVGTADRLLMVNGEFGASSTTIEECKGRLLDAQGTLLKEEYFTKAGQTGFMNVPASGRFFVEVSCASGKTKRYGPYLFERDHKIDLGKVVLP